jgi:polyisoprenoid-binding protein YceI
MNRITTLVLAAFSLAVSPAIFAATTFKVDPKLSIVKWEGKKVTGAHQGTIKVADGSLSVDKDKVTGGVVNVDTTSIVDEDIKDAETNAKLIGHLKSDDFFSADKHPRATLKLTKIVEGAKDGKGTHTITGDLTIKGKTHPVSFPATIKLDGGKLLTTADVIVDRTLYDIKYGSGKFFQGLGDKVINDQFTLNVSLVAQK